MNLRAPLAAALVRLTFPGGGASSNQPRREALSAGPDRRLAASGNFLRNLADPRDRNIPEPPQSKDEFVLKFVKP